MRTRQPTLLKNQPSAYGGDLLKTREGRSRGRPLSTRESMHLILRSTKAKAEWSFRKPQHARRIKEITERFATKYGVRIYSVANVGNHLHFHLKLSNRYTYKPFIRAITAAIAMAVTGASRWKPLKREAKDKFWDYRPFTRVVRGMKALLTLWDYLKINRIEGYGYKREVARFIVSWDRASSTKRLAGSG